MAPRKGANCRTAVELVSTKLRAGKKSGNRFQSLGAGASVREVSSHPLHVMRAYDARADLEGASANGDIIPLVDAMRISIIPFALQRVAPNHSDRGSLGAATRSADSDNWTSDSRAQAQLLTRAHPSKGGDAKPPVLGAISQDSGAAGSYCLRASAQANSAPH